jgi:hypothetical protein
MIGREGEVGDRLGVTERDLEIEASLLDRFRTGEDCTVRGDEDDNEVLVLRSVLLADPRLTRAPNNRTEGGGVRDPDRFTRFERRWYAGVVLSDWFSVIGPAD